MSGVKHRASNEGTTFYKSPQHSHASAFLVDRSGAVGNVPGPGTVDVDSPTTQSKHSMWLGGVTSDISTLAATRIGRLSRIDRRLLLDEDNGGGGLEDFDDDVKAALVKDHEFLKATQRYIAQGEARMWKL